MLAMKLAVTASAMFALCNGSCCSTSYWQSYCAWCPASWFAPWCASGYSYYSETSCGSYWSPGCKQLCRNSCYANNYGCGCNNQRDVGCGCGYSASYCAPPPTRHPTTLPPTGHPTITPCHTFHQLDCQSKKLADRCIWVTSWRQCREYTCSGIGQRSTCLSGGHDFMKCGWSAYGCGQCDQIPDQKTCKSFENCFWTDNMYMPDPPSALKAPSAPQICLGCGEAKEYAGLNDAVCNCAYCAWKGKIAQKCSDCTTYDTAYPPSMTRLRGWPCKKCMSWAHQCGKNFDHVNCSSLQNCNLDRCWGYSSKSTCLTQNTVENGVYGSGCAWTGSHCVEGWAFNQGLALGKEICKGATEWSLPNFRREAEGTTHAAELREDVEVVDPSGGEL